MALTSGNAQVVITDSTANTVSATNSGSYTVGPGTTGLFVAVALESNNSAGGDLEVVSLEYGGQALTFIARQHLSNAAFGGVEWWYLPAPPVGTAALDLGLTGTSDGYAVIAVEVHGPLAAPAVGTAQGKAQSTSTGRTIDITTIASGSLLFGIANTLGGNVADLTATSGTELADGQTGTDPAQDTNYWLAELDAPAADTYTISATGSTNRAYVMLAIEVLQQLDGVVVAAGTQGHTVASPGLAQIHALAAVAATQGHTTTAPFAGLQAFPVSVVAGHIVAAPGVAQAAVLKTVVGTQGHTVASPTLIQVNTLRSVSATTGHTITVGGLAQANLLLSVSPLTGHTVAAGGLLQQQIARVADALAGHIADPSKIVASLAMSVANVLTGHTVNVGMLHVLIPGQSPIEQTYAVLEDGRVYRIVGRGEGLVIPSETRNIDITPWGDLVQ